MATLADRTREPGRVTPASLLTVLRHPHKGWAPIARSHAGIGTVMVGLAMPLAAIRAAAGMAHDLLYGRGTMGIIEYRPTVAGALATAVAGWLISLAAMGVVAIALAALAPRFGGRPDRPAAFRAVTAASAPFFVASLFMLIPTIGFFQLLGLYGLFLLAIGAPTLLAVRHERGGAFGGIAAALALVVVIVALVATGAVARGSLRPTVETAKGRKVVTNAPAIAESRLSAPATDKKHAAAPGTAAAHGSDVPASSLQALLPVQIGGFRRAALQSQSNLSAGIATASAQATYVEGTDSFTLSITDAGQPGALATNDSAIVGEVNQVRDDGYQLSRVVDGVRVTEKWSNADHGGLYSRTVASRFTVAAQGTAPTVRTLRAAVASVDANRLGALGR